MVDRGWYDAAKFGIFVHWGLYSVTAWAETEQSFDPRHSAYSEWYWNTIQITNSPAAVRHRYRYGADWQLRARDAFRQQSAGWNAKDWADQFRRAGARYVVPVTKHHDGYCMWPTKIVNPHRADSDRFCAALTPPARPVTRWPGSRKRPSFLMSIWMSSPGWRRQ